MRRSIAERFHAKYIPEPNSGCWLWEGAIDRHGYGVMYGDDRKVARSHRVSYELHFGAIEPSPGYHGACVCHRCDNRACVNPAHLFLGTQADNVRDMHAKDRGVVMRGEGCKRAKISADDAMAIVARYRSGGVTRRELGAQFGISKFTVASIVRGTSWKHVFVSGPAAGRSRPTLSAFGRTQTFAEWSAETGVGTSVIRKRLARGWPPEYAVKTKSSRSNRIAHEKAIHTRERAVSA